MQVVPAVGVWPVWFEETDEEEERLSSVPLIQESQSVRGGLFTDRGFVPLVDAVRFQVGADVPGPKTRGLVTAIAQRVRDGQDLRAHVPDAAILESHQPVTVRVEAGHHAGAGGAALRRRGEVTFQYDPLLGQFIEHRGDGAVTRIAAEEITEIVAVY